jgi:hypothetical protein
MPAEALQGSPHAVKLAARSSGENGQHELVVKVRHRPHPRPRVIPFLKEKSFVLFFEV